MMDTVTTIVMAPMGDDLKSLEIIVAKPKENKFELAMAMVTITAMEATAAVVTAKTKVAIIFIAVKS